MKGSVNSSACSASVVGRHTRGPGHGSGENTPQKSHVLLGFAVVCGHEMSKTVIHYFESRHLRNEDYVD